MTDKDEMLIRLAGYITVKECHVLKQGSDFVDFDQPFTDNIWFHESYKEEFLDATLYSDKEVLKLVKSPDRRTRKLMERVLELHEEESE